MSLGVDLYALLPSGSRLVVVLMVISASLAVPIHFRLILAGLFFCNKPIR